jgi:hypothetical protein
VSKNIFHHPYWTALALVILFVIMATLGNTVAALNNSHWNGDTWWSVTFIVAALTLAFLGIGIVHSIRHRRPAVRAH